MKGPDKRPEVYDGFRFKGRLPIEYSREQIKGFKIQISEAQNSHQRLSDALRDFERWLIEHPEKDIE